MNSENHASQNEYVIFFKTKFRYDLNLKMIIFWNTLNDDMTRKDEIPDPKW